MTVTSPVLQRAQAALATRRGTRGTKTSDNLAAGHNRHSRMELAYSNAGQGVKGAPMLYFMVRYCPACLRGTVIDLVREVPDGLPSAHELGVKRQKIWRLECAKSDSGQ